MTGRGCRVVVTSCEPYARTTLPILFDSFVAAGVPMDRIRVVIAQCREIPQGIRIPDGVEIHAVPYAAEALTGLVHIAHHGIDDEWFLYVQDCSRVGPEFYVKANAILDKIRANPSLDVVKLVDKYSMSVGYYRTAWLMSKAPDLAKFAVHGDERGHVPIEEIRRIKNVIEDVAFMMADEERTGILGYWADVNVCRTVEEDYTYPGSTTRRAVEYYTALDYYKMKSWWGQESKVGHTFCADGTPIINFPVGV